MLLQTADVAQSALPLASSSLSLWTLFWHAHWIVKGVIHTTTKVKDTKTYTIANRNESDRVVMLEHPNRTGFKLTRGRRMGTRGG